MAKEYLITLREAEDGETKDGGVFSVHYLLYLEFQQMLSEHVGDNRIWVEKR